MTSSTNSNGANGHSHANGQSANQNGNGQASSSSSPMSFPEPCKDFHVSIVGGGIGGASLAVGLLSQGVPVDMYEAAPSFGEIGAGISIGINAETALRKLGMGVSRRYDDQRTKLYMTDMTTKLPRCSSFAPQEAFDRIYTGVPTAQYFQWRVGQAENSDNVFAETMSPPNGNTTVHRAEFLDQIVKYLPKERTHFGKRLAKITELPQGSARELKMEFEDGSSAETDLVIGMDGIHSKCRQHLDKEKSGPSAVPGTAGLQWSGTWAYRGLIPMQEWLDALGEEKGKAMGGETPFMALGRDTHMLCFPIQHHKTVNVVAFKTDRSSWPIRPKMKDSEPWTQKTTQEAFLKDFEGWSPDCLTMLKLIKQPAKWALHTIRDPLTSYISANGKIVVAGDAAHGGTPHHGALAGQAIEDALFYSRLLGCKDITKANLYDALPVIDEIRLPRGNRVMTSSLHAGDVYEFADDEMGHDLEKLAKHLPRAWDWIWEYDHDEEWQRGLAWLKQKGIIIVSQA